MTAKSGFFKLWKRSASETLLNEVFELTVREIPCKIVRTSLRWAWQNNYLHTFPSWSESLYDRLGLEGFRTYRQAVALRAKSDDVDIGADRSQNAWEKFCESEILNARQNKRMEHESQFFGSLSEDITTCIMSAMEEIAEVLGPVPSYGDLALRFGPGANVTCKGKTSARYKLSAQLGVSSEGMKAIPALKALHPRLFDGREVIEETAEVSDVPKNAETNRTIILQPLLNTFVQLGLGTHMKRRLHAAGLNLYTQLRNQRAACAASLDGRDATIDKKSASDSICVRAVELLLQRAHGWFDLLSTWRCGDTVAPKKNLRFRTSQFSSMGNGYTFELESLLFWTLARACMRYMREKPSRVCTYGDDVIIDARAVPLYTRVCEALGFRINTDKSFSDGRFRESCGGDYVLGFDVRPFYVKGRLTTARIVALRNFLYTRWRLPTVQSYLDQFLDNQTDVFIPWGPEGFGDGHRVLRDYADDALSVELHARCERSNTGGGWTFQTHVKRPRREKLPLGELQNDYLLPTYHLDERDIDLSHAILAVERLREPRTPWARDFALLNVRDDQSLIRAQERDPHVLRGGMREKVVTIYTLTL